MAVKQTGNIFDNLPESMQYNRSVVLMAVKQKKTMIPDVPGPWISFLISILKLYKILDTIKDEKKQRTVENIIFKCEMLFINRRASMILLEEVSAKTNFFLQNPDNKGVQKQYKKLINRLSNQRLNCLNTLVKMMFSLALLLAGLSITLLPTEVGFIRAICTMVVSIWAFTSDCLGSLKDSTLNNDQFLIEDMRKLTV